MSPRLCKKSWLTLGILGLSLAGCTEFAQRRFANFSEEPPQPAPALQIPGAPTVPAPAAPQSAANAPRNDVSEAPAGNPLRALAQKATQRYQTMDSYIMRLKRREVVAGKPRPEELILVKFRQEPFSVYFKWIGAEAAGREVVYVKGQPKNEIHTLTAAGDVLLLPAGARFSVSADSILVKSKSRYPITEAGLGSSVRRFATLVDAVEKGDTSGGTLKYLGRSKRPEFDEPMEGALQTIPASSDPLLSGGGQRWWFFDKAMGLPLLVVTHDENGREVEYYCNDRVQTPVRLDDDDFNPDKLWKKKDR